MLILQGAPAGRKRGFPSARAAAAGMPRTRAEWMKIPETLYVVDRAEWRAWLERHHSTAKPAPEVPLHIRQTLKANKQAWKTFQGLAPSYRRNYIRWIMDAKKEETRARRLEEAMGILAQN